MADAQHLPQGRCQAGDRHLKFYETRDNLFQEPRQEHSRKPQEIIQKIERMYDGPYLELFARERPNSQLPWAVWGNQIAADVSLPGYPVPEYTERGLARKALMESRDA